MMRSLLLFTLFLSAPAFAGLSSNFGVVSDYVWRGQTQTNHGAAVQGGLDYEHASGFSIGTWASNVYVDSTENQTELDVYASYSYSFNDDFAVSVGGIFYHYTQHPGSDTFESNIGFDFYMFNLSVNHTEEYFGNKSSSMYYVLSTELALLKSQGLSVGLSVGSTTFDKENVVGSEDYIDYKVSLNKTAADYTVGIFYTDTDRETTPTATKPDDHTVGVSAGRSFN